MDYNKLNKIMLSNDDAVKILEWDSENHKRFSSIEFPLAEGVLLLSGYVEMVNMNLTTGVYFKVESDGMLFAILDWQTRTELASYKMDASMVETGKFSNVKVYQQGISDEQMEKDFKRQAHLVMAIFQYMNHHKHIVESKIVRTSKVKKAKHKSGSKNRVVKLTSVEYRIDFAKENTDEKRSYERKTESWHQKGFWRYYKKSGKTVWIAEQIKGSGKNIEPKTYKM
ncbi:hypothetical protein [Paenibacillus agilis]|nr:hypothetical protein [Paenibacillus agilis]